MSFNVEEYKKELPETPERYKKIEQANMHSWYLTSPNRTFEAFQSVESVGDPRIDLTALTEEERASARVIAEIASLERVTAGGNMSPIGPYGPVEMAEEDRIIDAKNNMTKLFESLSISAESVNMLFPERDYTTPLTVIDIDTQPVEENTTYPRRVSTSGDFIYTRDPNKILAARPADCPIMFASADTPQGKLYMLVHYAWRGAANHYVEQTAVAFEALGVEKDSLQIYLTPGGQAESFSYQNYTKDPRVEYPGTEGLFVNVTEKTKDGSTVWDFNIDTPKFVYDQVIEKIGVDPVQVFCDTSDTSALNSGYSSHGRSSRLAGQSESNTRDIVIMRPTVS